MIEEKKGKDTVERVRARRWKVALRTIQNWQRKGEAIGALPPFDAEDANELIEWYRDAYGKEPKTQLKERAKELRREVGLEVVEVVEIDLGPIETIKLALERVGMDLTFSRIVEEEERAAAMYEVCRKQGASTSEARRQWKEASEMKRAAQKGEDAIQVARELLKEWVLKEFEPVQRRLRENLSGKELGKKARAALLETTTEKEWERVWDRELEAILAEG